MYKLTDISYKQWFMCLCLAQVILWTVGISLTRYNLPFDTVESIAWGLQMQLGYFKHPPFAAWLNALAFKIAGSNTVFANYLFAELCMVAVFICIWQTANRILHSPQKALIAVMLLCGMYFNSVIIPKMNPNQLMIPIWAMIGFNFYLCLHHRFVAYWLSLGVLCGCSMLTKYQAPLQWLPMFCVLVSSREGREHLKTPGPYLAALTCAIVLAPHVYNLYRHHFNELAYMAQSTNQQLKAGLHHAWPRLYFPFDFFMSNLFACAGVFIMAIPLIKARAPSAMPMSKLNRDFLFFLAFGPLISTLLFSAVTGAYLYSKWGAPFYSFLPIWLIAKLNPTLKKKHWIELFFYFYLFFWHF